MAEIDAEELERALGLVGEYVPYAGSMSESEWQAHANALSLAMEAALAHLAHLRAPKGELEEARADSRDVCWHCKDALIPEPPPHCESCPDYECGCDDEDCEAEGCLEREEKHRAALSRARGEGT